MIFQDLLGWFALLIIILGTLLISKKKSIYKKFFTYSSNFEIYFCNFRSIFNNFAR